MFGLNLILLDLIPLVAGAGFEGDGGGEVDNLISKAYTQAPIHEAALKR